MNRWTLKKEIEEKYKPLVQQFIDDLNNPTIRENSELLEKDFSDTELNPYTLCELLVRMGYKRDNQDDNGWELDFWITMVKSGYESIMVQGCGMTFELRLSEID